MEIREALRTQSPSLALQRAAADEIARLDGRVATLERLIELVGAHFADGEPRLPPLPETIR